MCEPLRHRGVYDFARTTLAARARDAGLDLAFRHGFLRAPPPETVFLHRKLVGTFLLCGRIRARVDVRALEVDQAVLTTLPVNMIRKHKVLPLRVNGKTLELLMANPADRVALAEVGVASGCIVKPYVVVEARLEDLGPAWETRNLPSHDR